MRTNPVFSVYLPPPLRHRAEAIGLACGSICFPFALFGSTLVRILPDSAAGIILPMIVCSALASALLCLVRRNDDPAEWVKVAPRAGIRAGWIAGLVAGGVTVLAATFHAFGIGEPASLPARLTWFALVLPKARVAQVLIIALMGIPPALFAAVASALAISLMRSASGPGDGSGRGISAAKWSALLIAAVALTVVGYLSPLTLWLRPSAPASLPTSKPTAVVATPPPPPSPPKWRYEKPATFDTAEAQSLTVLSHSRFGPIDADCPIAISNDGLRLACCRGSNDSSLLVYDLETLDEISVSLPQKPAAFAWSPDAKMILVVGGAPDRKLWVFDTEKRRWLALPKPVDGWLPQGRPIWWQDEEVLFTSSKPRVLDLVTLRALDPDTSSKWKGMTGKEREQIQSPVRLPRNARWAMRLEADMQQYDVPAIPSLQWRGSTTLRLVFGHPETGYRYYPPGLDVRPEDVVAATTDGTKVIRIRDSQADIFYFGVRPPAANRIATTMPSAPPEALTTAVNENRVCTFVCAPMINPLNGKTVGPDRTQVKALLRLASWVGTAGEFWIEEDYRAIQPGDVLADLHLWEKHQAKAAGDFAAQEWFTVVGKLEPDNLLPGRTNAKSLDRAMDVTLNDRRDVTRVASIAIHTSAQADSTPTPTPPADTARPVIAPAEVRSPLDEQKMRDAVKNLVNQRIAESSSGNVNGLIADYASRVEYMNHGTVGPDFIRKDIGDYHSGGARVSEALRGPINIKLGANNEVSVIYQFDFSRNTPDGKWVQGLAETSLRLLQTPQGLKIVEQHIKIRDKREGP